MERVKCVLNETGKDADSVVLENKCTVALQSKDMSIVM